MLPTTTTTILISFVGQLLYWILFLLWLYSLELGGVIYHSTNTCEFSFKMLLMAVISPRL
jgi:hypothetical protein